MSKSPIALPPELRRPLIAPPNTVARKEITPEEYQRLYDACCEAARKPLEENRRTRSISFWTRHSKIGNYGRERI